MAEKEGGHFQNMIYLQKLLSSCNNTYLNGSYKTEAFLNNLHLICEQIGHEIKYRRILAQFSKLFIKVLDDDLSKYKK